MDIFVRNRFSKVVVMPSINPDDRFENQSQKFDFNEENLTVDEDLLMEQILENINTTPIGQVLKRIALLPKARKDKVLTVRRQLTESKYNLDERLDIALDRVLEDLTA